MEGTKYLLIEKYNMGNDIENHIYKMKNKTELKNHLIENKDIDIEVYIIERKIDYEVKTITEVTLYE